MMNTSKGQKSHLIHAKGVLACLLLAIAVLFSACGNNTPETTTVPTVTTTAPTTAPTTQPTTAPTETTEPIPYIVSSATVGVTGDILVHPGVYNSCLQEDGTYDFNEIYEYVAPYYQQYDYMVANLEVTFGGLGTYPYSGYPTFNCPDPMADALKNAGVDMVLTANNHTYDTRYNGMLRTIEVLDNAGLEHIGTRTSVEQPNYIVKDINGIKIGMACYTYETTKDFSDGRKSLNGLILTEEASKLVSSFRYWDLEDFYRNVEADLQGMKEDGAEFTMLYVHWGNEYKTTPNSNQTTIAQGLCDLGVDIIVGGHPHVIQPFETLTSESGHTTYCIYSTGNAISNQRRDLIGSAPNGHTEDGIIFEVEFEYWSDGSYKIAEVGVIPTWVDRPWNGGDIYYAIYPIVPPVESWESYRLDDFDDLRESYSRTMKILGDGINACREAMGLMLLPDSVD